MKHHRLMLLAAVPALLLTLTACAPRLPEIEVLPYGPDPRVCVPILPEPPPEGSIVIPVTAEERVAVRDHLTSDAASREWGRSGWSIVAIAQRGCVP